MKSRIRTRKKSTREQTPDFSTAPAQPMFQSRPFVVQTQSVQKSQQPDLKTSLRRAQRYGHHLSRLQPAGIATPTVVQPKMGNVEPTNKQGENIQVPPSEGVVQRVLDSEEARNRLQDAQRSEWQRRFGNGQRSTADMMAFGTRAQQANQKRDRREQAANASNSDNPRLAAAYRSQRDNVFRNKWNERFVTTPGGTSTEMQKFANRWNQTEEQAAKFPRADDQTLEAAAHMFASHEKRQERQQVANAPTGDNQTLEAAAHMFASHEREQAVDEKLRQQRAEREQELQELRGNKQPEPYKGTGIGKDARLMVEDPRFKAGYGVQPGYGYQPGYKLERESDPKGFGRRIGPKTYKASKNYLTKHTEELKADPVRYGAELLTNKLPLIGTGKHIASAVHEGKRQKINKSVAKNDNADELTQSIATGLAKNHKRERIMQGIGAGLSGASGVASAVTGGASLAGDHAIKSAITRTIPHIPGLLGEINLVGKGATGINLAATAGGKTQELIASKDRQTRLASRLPQQEANTTNPADAQAHKNKVDEANKALISLGKEDPDFGRAMLAHLSQPAQEPEQEMKSVFSQLNSQKGGADTTSGVVKENTLKPSDVARLTAPEKARLRQRERMQVTDNHGQELNLLEILRKNEKKKWYENK